MADTNSPPDSSNVTDHARRPENRSHLTNRPATGVNWV